MQVDLIAVGRMKAGPERDLLGRYVERARAMARPLGLAGPALREVEEGRARDEASRRGEEARAILAALPADAALIALDERGRSVGSPAIAAIFARTRDGGRPALALVVGGPDGLDETVRQRANHVLAFGAATFPHQIVRILAAEQVYRAMTILAGHPYHRA